MGTFGLRRPAKHPHKFLAYFRLTPVLNSLMLVGLRSFLRHRVFGSLSDRRELSRMRKRYRDTVGSLRYRRELSHIRKENWRNRHQPVEELRIFRERIAYLETNRLLTLARKYHLPTPELDREALLGHPDPNSQWQRPRELHLEVWKLILRPMARMELQSAIRAARKERLETVRLWITTIVPGLTGLLGVIVALLAIVLGRR
jgi:hypothetical protein